MVDRAKLRAEHEDIADMARALIAIVEAPLPPDPLSFLRFRRDFGRVLTRHLKHEEWAVYPVLLNHRDGAVRATADALCRESQAFGAEFMAYARDWTADRIGREWDGFRATTRTMIGRLLDRIETEENRLYPLLDRPPSAMSPTPIRRAG